MNEDTPGSPGSPGPVFVLAPCSSKAVSRRNRGLKIEENIVFRSEASLLKTLSVLSVRLVLACLSNFLSVFFFLSFCISFCLSVCR